MTALPAAGYFSDPVRTNAEAKTAQDDILAFVRQMLGGQTPAELTIASGAAVPTRGMHTIDTEADAASDDLTNLDTTNLPDGSWLLIGCADAARVVTVKHNAGGAGQIALTGAADAVLDATSKYILLRRSGANWAEIGRFGFEAAIADGSVTARKESDDAWSSAASASTVDLGAINSRNVNITGTTTITSFGNTGGEGRAYRVRFSGALTLTHNATSLILPGGANIATAAGDTAEFVKESGTGNWRCTDYQKASGQALVVPVSGGITLGTPNTTTGGSTIDYTSITSGRRRVTVVFNGVSLSGTDNIRIQIGDNSGGVKTSGYTGQRWSSGSPSSIASLSAGFEMAFSDASAVVYGALTLTLMNSSNNTWVATGFFVSPASSQEARMVSGVVSLSAELDRVRITTSGANTFDAMSVNIIHEA